ncbi:MAG: chromosome segregation protein SMC [Thermodesulfobacteriota bacterium]
MKLKKLEIVGFKSFLEKANIEFPPGISAVVGPNGCGKSNIVDALRWVMGEQSVKQLRGKAMEDIIFSGADGKSAMNMAEVSLTLANDNGSAPEELKDCSEIMITRRQYRSGERAYYLNRQPCRLKDIHNIFWGSGMGARSYAVIQQGNIGAITDAGPEERRFFIEEAAGITRYKNRKNEALRKVDATQQNILRVNDIIAEVKRQMGGLHRQAKKAELFKGLQEQLKVLEIVAAAYYFDDYERQLHETALLLRELKDTDIEHASQLARLDAAIEEIKLARARKDHEISQQKTQKFEVQRTTDKIENDSGYLRKDVQTLTQEIIGLETARVELERKNKQIADEVVAADTEMERLQQEIGNEKALLEDKHQSARTVTEHLSHLNSQLEESKKQLMRLVAEEARYKNIYQNASNNKESLKRRLRRIDEEDVLARRKAAELEKAEMEANSSFEAIRSEKEDLIRQIAGIEARLDEKNKALSEQVKFVQTTEFERHKVKSRLTALVKMEDNFEWYRDGVKAVMKRNAAAEQGEAGETGATPGILGLMADIIEPQPGFENAVEAVLGESMQYILINHQEVGTDAIRFLQDNNAGRSGFIPVDRLKKIAREPEKIPENAERLLSRISVKSGFEDTVKAVLADVLIADDLHAALNMWNRSNGDGPYTLVTKNGDVISASGIMIGGSQDKLAGILIKKQEIRSLEQRMAEFDRVLLQGREMQAGLETAVRQLETELQKAIVKKNHLLQMETEAEKHLYRVGEDLKHARRHMEVVRLEQEQLLGEESDIDDEIARNNEALTQVENEVKAYQQKVAEINGEIESVSREQAVCQQSVMDVKLKLTALNARLDNSRHTYKRLRDFQADGEKRLVQLTEEIEQKMVRSKSARERLLEYDQKLPGMYEALKRLEETIESNEAEFHSIDARLQENDEAVNRLQGKREQTTEKIRRLELEQTQRKMQQENIGRRMEEKYHQPLANLREGMIWPAEESREIGRIEAELVEIREKIAAVGDVNLGAIHEYEELTQRFEFLNTQRDDLVKALEDLQKVIRKINQITQDRFMQTFHLVNEKLNEVFPRLFAGGAARLVLTEPDNPLETGVELMIHPPGKKLTRLSLLSGGEKALSAIAFIFAIFLIKPASFCLMDEIDAPLDEANVYRFNELLKIIGEKSQIVMITHNKKSMEFADVLFGVTMEKKGISKIVSVNFERARQPLPN